MPQTPAQDISDAFDKPSEIKKYISRLGNLTLLEKSINASIGNGSFADKKAAYMQSGFYLTKSIAQPVKVGTNTAIDRAVENLKTFETWTSQSIEERQQVFTELAIKIWDMEDTMPEVAVESASSESASEATVISEETLEADT